MYESEILLQTIEINCVFPFLFLSLDWKSYVCIDRDCMKFIQDATRSYANQSAQASEWCQVEGQCSYVL